MIWYRNSEILKIGTLVVWTRRGELILTLFSCACFINKEL